MPYAFELHLPFFSPLLHHSSSFGENHQLPYLKIHVDLLYHPPSSSILPSLASSTSITALTILNSRLCLLHHLPSTITILRSYIREVTALPSHILIFHCIHNFLHPPTFLLKTSKAPILFFLLKCSESTLKKEMCVGKKKDGIRHVRI